MKPVEFIQHLTLCEDFSGKPFVLRDWQKAIVEKIFTTLPDGTRQYRKVFLFLPRKNGKTQLLAAIAVYCLFLEPQGSEIYSAAADIQQASLIFRKAAQMIRADPCLRTKVKILDSQKKILHKERNSFYRAMSSDVEGAFGGNPSVVLFDELVAQKDDRLWNVLMSGFGARRNPLAIAISTAGENKPESLLTEQFDYAVKVRDGVINDDAYLPFLYYAQPDDDWQDEQTWIKANPVLQADDDWSKFLLRFLRSEFVQAEQLSSKEFAFRTLYLNQFRDNLAAFIRLDMWDKCLSDSKPAGSCIGGLDLSSTTDLTAFVLLFDDFVVRPYFFVPEEIARHRERTNRTRLDAWIQQSWIEQTDGNVIDYDYIRRRINELREEHDIREIALDKWNATQLATQLDGDGFTLHYFPQNYSGYTAPCKELLNLVMSGRLQHDGNPVLRWNVSNLKVEQDPLGNLRPSKKKSVEKIDGCCGLLMALGRHMVYTQSIYETAGIDWI